MKPRIHDSLVSSTLPKEEATKTRVLAIVNQKHQRNPYSSTIRILGFFYKHILENGTYGFTPNPKDKAITKYLAHCGPTTDWDSNHALNNSKLLVAQLSTLDCLAMTLRTLLKF